VENQENDAENHDSDKEDAIDQIVVQEPRRSARLRGSQAQMMVQLAISDGYVEPLTIRQALTGPDQAQWLEAIRSETRSLRVNHTWDYVTRPLNRQLVGCR